MKNDIQRFIVENEGPIDENFKIVFAQAFQLAKTKNNSKITLIYPTKKTFLNSNVVTDLLGNNICKQLVKGEGVNIDGIEIKLEIPVNVSSWNAYDIVIGLYLGTKGIDALDSINSANAIIFLPWLKDEGVSWISTWSPTVIGSKTWQVQSSTIPEYIVEELSTLTNIINLSTGLSHPSDKTTAERILKRIKSNGYKLNAEDVRKWAIKNNWQPRHAEQLNKLVLKIHK